MYHTDNVCMLPCVLDNGGGLVLGSTPRGLLVWRVAVKKTAAGPHKVMRVAVPDGKIRDDQIFYMHMSSEKGVRTTRAVVVPPGKAAKELKDSCSDALLITADGPPEDVLSVSAKTGLEGMLVEHLSKLMTHLGMKFATGTRPTKETELIAALIRHINPWATDEDILQAIAFRKKVAIDASWSLLHYPDNLDQIENGVDQDDLLEIKKTLKDTKHTSKPGERTSTPKDRPLHRDDQSPGPAPPKVWKLRPRPSGDEAVELELAKGFLPKVKGVTLSKDTKRFSRWSGHFQSKAPPRYVTKSWAPRPASTRARRFELSCSSCAWNFEQPGPHEACPWDLAPVA